MSDPSTPMRAFDAIILRHVGDGALARDIGAWARCDVLADPRLAHTLRDDGRGPYVRPRMVTNSLMRLVAEGLVVTRTATGSRERLYARAASAATTGEQS